MNSQTFMYGLGCGSGTTTITLKFGEQTTSPEQIRYCQVLEKKLKTAPLSVQIGCAKIMFKKNIQDFIIKITEITDLYALLKTATNAFGMNVLLFRVTGLHKRWK